MHKSPLLLLLLAGLVGCSIVFHGGGNIPPPGGCDRCHQVPISSNWQAVLTSVEVPQPGDRYPWQRPEGMTPSATEKGQQLVEEECFRCHRSPDKIHAGYRGQYHHRH